MLHMKSSCVVLAVFACTMASAANRFDVCTKDCLGGGITPLTNERALLQAPCFVEVSSSRVDCYSYTSPTSGKCPFGDNSVDCGQAPTTTTAPTTTSTPGPTTTLFVSTLPPTSTAPSDSNATTNNTTPLGQKEDTSTMGNAPYFIGGGVALIALGILVIVLVRKSRRTDHDDDDDLDAHVLHVEQRTKQITNEPAFAVQPSVAYPFTPTGHQNMDYRTKQNSTFHQQRPMPGSPHGGARAANNESFVRSRLPSGLVDPPLRILTVDPPQDYRALEAERGSVTF